MVVVPPAIAARVPGNSSQFNATRQSPALDTGILTGLEAVCSGTESE